MSIESLLIELENGSFQPEPMVESDASVFIAKVREYETDYKMTWLQFQAKYERGELPIGESKQRSDFATWHMLCLQFYDTLVSDLFRPRKERLEEAAQYEGPRDRALTLLLSCFCGS